MLTDHHGRDHVTVAEAAFDADYKLQAIRIDCVSNLGAYNSPYGQHIASDLALKVMPGVYDVQKAFFAVKGVFTNTTPVDAYRGAGRPEAIYVIERLIDWSARDLGLDPVELRRRNFIPKEAFPYRSVSGETYDVGDFDRVLDRAIDEADIAGFPARKAASAKARQAPRPRARLLHRVDPRRPERDDDDRLRRRRHGRALRRHPVERPGPRDRLRPDPPRAERHPLREDPLRPGRQRPHRRAAAAPAARARRRCRATRSTTAPTRSSPASARSPRTSSRSPAPTSSSRTAPSASPAPTAPST